MSLSISTSRTRPSCALVNFRPLWLSARSMRWILFSYEVKEDLCFVACCSVGKRGKGNNILRRADANNSSYNYCVEVDKITFENCLPCPTKSTWILTRSHFEVLLIAHSFLLHPSSTNNFLQFGQIHFTILSKTFEIETSTVCNFDKFNLWGIKAFLYDFLKYHIQKLTKLSHRPSFASLLEQK